MERRVPGVRSLHVRALVDKVDRDVLVELHHCRDQRGDTVRSSRVDGGTGVQKNSDGLQIAGHRRVQHGREPTLRARRFGVAFLRKLVDVDRLPLEQDLGLSLLVDAVFLAHLPLRRVLVGAFVGDDGSGVDVGAGVDEEADDVRVAFGRGKHQGRVAGCRRGVRTVRQQQFDDPRASRSRRQHQRRLACRAGQVRVRRRFEQPGRNVRVRVHARQHQRRDS